MKQKKAVRVEHQLRSTTCHTVWIVEGTILNFDLGFTGLHERKKKEASVPF